MSAADNNLRIFLRIANSLWLLFSLNSGKIKTHAENYKNSGTGIMYLAS